MGQLWIRELVGGLDVRRLPETTPGGVLLVGTDGHITRGGEFESRASFVNAYTLPAGTVGLAYMRTGLVAFGSATEPSGMPVGFIYQRLQHPDGSTELIDVPSFDLYSGKIYAVGVFADGSTHHFYDGARVEDWFDGSARATFRVTGGESSTPSKITSIKVNGVEILVTTVNWTTSNAVTAEAIASQINSTLSDPEYTAIAVDENVVILASDQGEAINDAPVIITVADGFATVPAGDTTVTGSITMTGGAEAEDTFDPGTFVKTFGSKVYSVSGPNMHFSGIQQPTKWTTDAVGAGFIDMSSYASGSENLVALAKYQSNIAVFAEGVIQIWYTDPDPTLNRTVQDLNNTGTSSPLSVTQFGDGDIFYLDESGIRSLRARDSSNAASTNDIGVAIDPLVTAKLQSLSDTERSRVIGLIEPTDGRFWLIMKDVIYVLSYFSGGGAKGVSAWTTYEPGFTTTAAVVFNKRVVLRSGDSVYVYGGLGSTLAYDATEAVAQLPYLDGDQPTQGKKLKGVDAAVRGEWVVHLALNPENEDAKDKVGTITGSTFMNGKLRANGSFTHVSPIFRSSGIGPHTLGSIIIHFESADGTDK